MEGGASRLLGSLAVGQDFGEDEVVEGAHDLDHRAEEERRGAGEDGDRVGRSQGVVEGPEAAALHGHSGGLGVGGEGRVRGRAGVGGLRCVRGKRSPVGRQGEAGFAAAGGGFRVRQGRRDEQRAIESLVLGGGGVAGEAAAGAVAEQDGAFRVLRQAGADLVEHEPGEGFGQPVALRAGAESGAVETGPGEPFVEGPPADQVVEFRLAGSEFLAVGAPADAAEAPVGADDQRAVPVGEAGRVAEDEAARRFARRQAAAGGDRGDDPLGDQRVAVGAARQQRLAPAVDVEVEPGVAAEGREEKDGGDEGRDGERTAGSPGTPAGGPAPLLSGDSPPWRAEEGRAGEKSAGTPDSESGPVRGFERGAGESGAVMPAGSAAPLPGVERRGGELGAGAPDGESAPLPDVEGRGGETGAGAPDGESEPPPGVEGRGGETGAGAPDSESGPSPGVGGRDGETGAGAPDGESGLSPGVGGRDGETGAGAPDSESGPPPGVRGRGGETGAGTPGREAGPVRGGDGRNGEPGAGSPAGDFARVPGGRGRVGGTGGGLPGIGVGPGGVRGNSRSSFGHPVGAMWPRCGAKPHRVAGGGSAGASRIGAAAAALGRIRTPGVRPGFFGPRRRQEDRPPRPEEALRPAVRSSPTSFGAGWFRGAG